MLPSDDKTAWGDGPWVNEPEYASWTTGVGLPCVAKRLTGTGQWAGYVGVPPDHPRHGQDARGLIAHGTIVAMTGDDLGLDPGYWWWFGFDCGHSALGDFVPGYAYVSRSLHLPTEATVNDSTLVYRDLAYVSKWCAVLALQLSRTVDQFITGSSRTLFRCP